MSAELEHIWSRVQDELALSVDEATYRIWLAPLQALQLDERCLTLQAPPHSRGWIGDRFGRLLESCAASVLGDGARVQLVDDGRSEGSGEGGRPSRRAGRSQRLSPPGRARTSAQRADPSPAAGSSESRSGPLGNPKLTFEQFVIGDSNRLAHAAALTVAEMPAQAYNPLFICGPPGVGKTHLLSAIATLLLAHSPTLTVRCTTGEAFTNDFLDSL
ncbi:MAG: DnaA ATPase domain-containing protein, partial [Solirubrobacteraceae bacterium]